jgi:hypothetical protein
MNLSTSLVSLSAAAMIFAGPTQVGLQRVSPQSIPLSPLTDFDAAPWATALQDTDLVQRKASYEGLVDLAGRNPSAVKSIKAWAVDTSNVELAWTAQLLLRELETRSTARRSPFGLSQGSPFGLHDLDSLFDDLQGQHGGGLFGFGGADPFDGLDLDQFIQGGSSSGSGMQIFQDGDGVRIEITETEGGKSHTKKYEAPTMEELLETHPELEGRVNTRQSFPAFPFQQKQFLPPEPDLDLFWNQSKGNGGLKLIEPSLDRLGIQMLTPENRTMAYPGADADVGLQVVEVLPGSLAEAVGIKKGDLVISIDGQSIRGAEDVRKALGATHGDKKIDIRVIDQGGAERNRSWLPRKPL